MSWEEELEGHLRGDLMSSLFAAANNMDCSCHGSYQTGSWVEKDAVAIANIAGNPLEKLPVGTAAG